MQFKLLDRFGPIVAGVVFIVGLITFYSETNHFWGSFTAAVMSGALAWVAYTLTRWLFLAMK